MFPGPLRHPVKSGRLSGHRAESETLRPGQTSLCCRGSAPLPGDSELSMAISKASSDLGKENGKWEQTPQGIQEIQGFGGDLGCRSRTYL